MNISIKWVWGYFILLASMGLVFCIIVYPLFFQQLGAALALMAVVWSWIVPDDL